MYRFGQADAGVVETRFNEIRGVDFLPRVIACVEREREGSMI